MRRKLRSRDRAIDRDSQWGRDEGRGERGGLPSSRNETVTQKSWPKSFPKNAFTRSARRAWQMLCDFHVVGMMGGG